jgi:hypothetical protein
MLRPVLMAAVVLAVPALAGAQGTPRPQAPDVPRHMVPPVGKCRIWMDGVTPAQQPAPTDCQTALRQKPANGTVIFGPMERDVAPSGFRSTPSASRGDSARRTQATRGRPAPRREPPDTIKPPAAEPPEPTS